MASRAKRLKVVLTLAHKAEQEAATRLQSFRDKIDRERQQLVQLQDYSEQYLAAYAARRQNVSAVELISYSQFVARIGDLQKEQEAKLIQLEAQLEPYLMAWRIAHQKHQKLEELIERIGQDEQIIADKAAQKMMDELATQRFVQEVNQTP